MTSSHKCNRNIAILPVATRLYKRTLMTGLNYLNIPFLPLNLIMEGVPGSHVKRGIPCDSPFSTKGANAVPSWRLPLPPGPVHVTGDQLRSAGVRMWVGGLKMLLFLLLSQSALPGSLAAHTWTHCACSPLHAPPLINLG